MINLTDPAAPLVLGLRRTLGFQIVVTALGPDPFPRLAGIVLMVLAVNLAGSVLVRWRRGAIFEPGAAFRCQQGTEGSQSKLAAWPRAVVFCVWLGGWSLLAWLPVVGLLRMGLAALELCTAGRSCGEAGDRRSVAAVDNGSRATAARTFGAAWYGHYGDSRPSGLAAAWPPGSTKAECRQFARSSDPSAGYRRGYSGAGAHGPGRVAFFHHHSRMAACRALDGTLRHCVCPQVLARFSGFRGSLPGLFASKIDLAGRTTGA